MGIGMIAGILLFWIVLIVLVVLLVRGLFSSNNASRPDSFDRPLTAIQILEQRYARGEINQEQYLQIQKDLASTGK